MRARWRAGRGTALAQVDLLERTGGGDVAGGAGQGARRAGRAVERIEDWDDARYAVLPPRSALDQRLTLIHFRFLTLLGRVNTRRGWCELSQSGFAKQLGYARLSVVAAVKELVEWGYLEKLGQGATGSARCHYRVLIDEPETPAVATGEPQDVETCHPGDDTPTCHPGDDTGVTREVTDVSCIKTHYLDHRSEIIPPNPPKRGARERRVCEIDLILERLGHEDRDRARVIELLLRPVVTRLRVDAPSVEGSLKALADWGKARQASDKVLRAAAARVLEQRKSSVKVADLSDALVHPAVRAADLVKVSAGSAEWAAWLDHERRKSPTFATTIEGCSSWLFPSRWPPGHAETGAPGTEGAP